MQSVFWLTTKQVRCVFETTLAALHIAVMLVNSGCEIRSEWLEQTLELKTMVLHLWQAVHLDVTGQTRRNNVFVTASTWVWRQKLIIHKHRCQFIYSCQSDAVQSARCFLQMMFVYLDILNKTCSLRQEAFKIKIPYFTDLCFLKVLVLSSLYPFQI